MQKEKFSLAALLFAALCLLPQMQAQETTDSTGLPGDHFSLEAAIALFQKAQSPEDFEKMLNAEDNGVNNLDLNEDGRIDYIRVEDHMEGDVHALVLQVPLDEKEVQDIAVIEIEKTGKEEAILQIVGDEAIYGEQVIVEPADEAASGGGKGGPEGEAAVHGVVVNVWLWPSVRFVYAPGYRIWVSPWRWGYYPPWWRPWRPRPWRWYHRHVVVVHRPKCRVVTTHRVVRAHKVYVPKRRSSAVVVKRTNTVVHTRKGVTVKKSTTTTRKGVSTNKGKAGVKKTTQTTTVTRGNKKVGVQKTTTTKAAKTKKGAAVKKTKTTKAGKKTPKGRAGVKKTTTVKKGRKRG